MEISSTSNTAHSRPVTASKSSSDRQTYDDVESSSRDVATQNRAQDQRAVHERLQQQKENSERRLDGRLISFGPEEKSYASEQKQVSFNRSRVNEAYSPPPDNHSTSASSQSSQSAPTKEAPIDIIV
ncbi:MAG: hypothetical protein QM484_10970 [Woeseiaceae bacterium]